jgi:tetratricopeptide (TPR) repeat protein
MGRLILGLLLLSVPAAHAQSDGSARAKELYANGKRLFEEEQYSKALLAWEEAHKLSERPLLLFNIALAQEKLGQLEMAIENLYTYRAFAPAEEQDMLVEKIADLKAALAAALALATAQAAAAKESEPAPAPAPAPAPVASPEQSRAPLFISWTATGVAVASGITFGLMAQSQRGQINNDLCDDLAGTTLCQAEARSALESSAAKALAADISWGIAAVGLGTSLWLTLRAKPTVKGPEFFVGPQSLGLRGTF